MKNRNNQFKSHEASAALGVKHFHEQVGRLNIAAKMEKYEARFMDPETGLLKKELEEYRSCPVCGSNDFQTSFVKFGFSYCICNDCQMLYVNPILNKRKLNDDYRSSEEMDGGVRMYLDPVTRKFDEPKFLKALDMIESASGPVENNKILDIGCSAGFFLELARDRKWDCTGIELNNIAADHTENLGFNVIRQPLEKGLFPENTFDAVTMWDVFEHLSDPGSILEIIRTILKPGGIVSMIVPNSDSLAGRIMREQCNMFRGSKHLNIFNPSNLTWILNQHEYKVNHIESLIAEISAINNYLTYQHPYKGDSDERMSILGLIGEDIVLKNLLGYKLFCIATSNI